ncbi:putative fungal alpha-L-arabinofuranosidase [Diplocarpon rosae]|nr:putative fungal alpha-L-arabinofuranosidase [Diplocarpon rosae]
MTSPCDIYASGGTPCVAAHSTTRALYSAYTGPLYEVKRGSDNTTTIIYDQSGKGNHLTQAPPGGFRGPESNGYDNYASAIGAPVTLDGKKAYGVFISPGTGYSNNAAVDTATGDEPQGIYAVLDGTHYNSPCCFDYGNAEVSSTDTGNGHMEAIYFGDNTGWGSGNGSGPWLMADLENGLFSGLSPGKNEGDPSISDRFFTAIVKGTANLWALRGANAASGSLSTYYSGIRPTASGYNPMSKEGAIILGIGGDNSNGAQGTFYEGVMTTGYPSDATENSVQADIVAAKYATTSLTSGPAFKVGSSVSFQVTKSGYTTYYLAHNGSSVNIEEVSSSSTTALKQQASWIVRSGLANSACFSFESKDTAGSYLRHDNFVLLIDANDDSKGFKEDATFCPQTGLNTQGNSIRSWNYPTRFIRHYSLSGYVGSNGGIHSFDAADSFNDDASWVVTTGFA